MRELSNLKQLRDRRKASKSIQKMGTFSSNHSEREASNRDEDAQNLQELYMGDKQIQIRYKLIELQSQLDQLNESSNDRPEYSEEGM